MVNPLAALKAKRAESDAREAYKDLPKVEYLKLGTGKSVRVRFLQELDNEASGYNGSYGKSPKVLPGADPDDVLTHYDIGLALIAEERGTHRDNMMPYGRVLDTMKSEGRDYAAEMFKRNPHEEGWKLKTNLYITALVDDGSSVKKMVISRSVYSELVDELVDLASDNETLTDRIYEISKGRKQSSGWRIVEAKDQSPITFDDETPFDLARQAVYHVEYDRQKAWHEKNYIPSPRPDGDESKEDSGSPWESDEKPAAKDDPWGGDDSDPEW